ncbi:hypothetical protein M8C21_022495, partial [Ambrosia artemisiifolia]
MDEDAHLIIYRIHFNMKHDSEYARIKTLIAGHAFFLMFSSYSLLKSQIELEFESPLATKILKANFLFSKTFNSSVDNCKIKVVTLRSLTISHSNSVVKLYQYSLERELKVDLETVKPDGSDGFDEIQVLECKDLNCNKDVVYSNL